jgi:phosphoribosylamine--glycine ligase
VVGDEVSFMVVSDGTNVVPLASARDYKRLGDGDSGPNTGGMGAISPAPVDAALAARILSDIVRPTVAGLAAEGRPYRGVLYAGVMVTGAGPQLLEYNCRFGDPETQAVLPRLDSDLVALLRGAASGGLGAVRPSWRREATACVVLAAGGYPGAPRRGDAISGLVDALAQPGVAVFHAGTAVQDGRLVTAGGRVLSVVGRGATLPDAVRTAYAAAAYVEYEGKVYRRDIGGGLS